MIFVKNDICPNVIRSNHYYHCDYGELVDTCLHNQNSKLSISAQSHCDTFSQRLDFSHKVLYLGDTHICVCVYTYK